VIPHVGQQSVEKECNEKVVWLVFVRQNKNQQLAVTQIWHVKQLMGALLQLFLITGSQLFLQLLIRITYSASADSAG
jgi:hypothetical protein